MFNIPTETKGILLDFIQKKNNDEGIVIEWSHDRIQDCTKVYCLMSFHNLNLNMEGIRITNRLHYKPSVC